MQDKLLSKEVASLFPSLGDKKTWSSKAEERMNLELCGKGTVELMHRVRKSGWRQAETDIEG